MRIVVAMSGGVDSSTAAALLVEQGHEVLGLAMKTHAQPAGNNRACCTPDDLKAARETADTLDIPLHILDYQSVFEEEVIRPFVNSYRQGQTPNPCIACNDKVKFQHLLHHAKLLGADKLATGHYSQVKMHGEHCSLYRAEDRAKDQSYFLYRLSPKQLQYVCFPIGQMNKQMVREHARRLGLSVADKPESQEICFVGKKGYTAVVEEYGGAMTPGKICDDTGKTLGEHQGIHHFTLGQRRGLKIAHATPLYVTHIDAKTHTVTVSGQESLETSSVRLQSVVLHKKVEEGKVLYLQQRYRDRPKPVTLSHGEQATLICHFQETTPRGAPGQAGVLYDQDEVVGGGILV
jgi:tRNA-specific 2-thiouridylase